MLCIGDTHGNYTKTKCFLEYKPEEQHLFVGDYFDSFVATVEQQLETFNLIVNSGAIMLTGNHDIQYFKSADHRVMCSGFSGNLNIVEVIENNKDRLFGAYYEEESNCVITHGGVHPFLFGKKKLGGGEIVDIINAHFEIYKTHGIDGVSKFYNCDTTIFNIGSIRGGWNQFGGPFWLDYRYEKLDQNFNQVFGHTKSKEPKKMINKQTWYVPIDTTEYKCYNTKTGTVEDFLPESLEDQRDMLEKVCY